MSDLSCPFQSATVGMVNGAVPLRHPLACAAKDLVLMNGLWEIRSQAFPKQSEHNLMSDPATPPPSRVRVIGRKPGTLT